MGMRVSFEPFETVASEGFWVALARHKLDVLKLDESPVEVRAFGDLGVPGRRSRVHLNEQSMPPFGDAYSESSIAGLTLRGVVILLNTKESYEAFDKKKLMGSLREDWSLKNALPKDFYMVAYADLKRFRFRHHVLYPALFDAGLHFRCEPLDLPTQSIKSIRKLDPTDGPYSIGRLKDALGHQSQEEIDALLIGLYDQEKQVCVLRDTCGVPLSESPETVVLGWRARNFLLSQVPSGTEAKPIRVLVIRQHAKDSFLCLIQAQRQEPSPSISVTGWELNEEGLVGEKQVVDLSRLMDPVRIAREASSLNLKLMKWRMLPELDIDCFAHQRVLIIGAGTLGCNVARGMLGWGVRSFVFVDCGHVSASNPCRQSLYTFADCFPSPNPAIRTGEKCLKAQVAAKRLAEIDPNVGASGEALLIPCPGRLLSSETETKEAIARLDFLVTEADVVFNVTDSRESRWLPTLLGAAHRKLVVTVALGFDNDLVMRHGISGPPTSTSRDQGPSNDGERDARGRSAAERLGCYFCQDHRAPRDTSGNRTLDQECTVTRPGLSLMAAGAAVELVASVLQHPLGAAAPVTTCTSPTDALDPADCSILGVVPHQIRGFLSHQQTMHLSGVAYEHCTACSAALVEGARAPHHLQVIYEALRDPQVLESEPSAALDFEALDLGVIEIP